MEKLLDTNYLNSQNLFEEKRLRIKKNYLKSSLFLHSTNKLQKLSKHLFHLKIAKTNNQTNTHFFNSKFYRRLKLSKRRYYLNFIKLIFLAILIIIVYFYCYNEKILKTKIKNEDYRKYKIFTENNYIELIEEKKLKQIDLEEKSTYKIKKQENYERQHLFKDTSNDRSSNSYNSINYNFYQSKEENAQNSFVLADLDNQNINIKNKILNNNGQSNLSSIFLSTTLPAINESINLSKNETLSQNVLLQNQSYSRNSIVPLDNSKSILQKQLSWYELVGITIFNILGKPNIPKNETHFKNLKIEDNSKKIVYKPFTAYNEKNDDSKKKNSSKNYGLKQRLPQCIIIGVRKAGTRAVLEYLSLNDFIKKADNEVHFFDNDDHYSLGLEFYKNQMPFSNSNQITIEKSPAYFVTSDVPERIKAMNSSIKLVLIVRDPVIRLVSDYTQLAHNKMLKIDDTIRNVGLNKQYLTKFPEDIKKLLLVKQQLASNEESVIVKNQQHFNMNTDYWKELNKIGSKFDYRNLDQLDELEKQQSPINVKKKNNLAKDRKRRYSNWQSNQKLNVDSASNTKKKYIDFKNYPKNIETIDFKTYEQNVKPKIINFLKGNLVDRKTRQIDQQSNEDAYKVYKNFNIDEEDIELVDYNNLAFGKKKIFTKKNEETILKSTNQLVFEKIDDQKKIPKFEDLVIRNGEVNTNYKPVKTSIYSLYMINWLRVFKREQIHIVNGDKLIKEPHIELNKLENFLGLPSQISRNDFIFNKKKNFFCARVKLEGKKDSFNNSTSSNTSWRRKLIGRHSSIRCLNSSKGRRHPQVDKQVISKLRQFYAPFNRHFERMVGIRFNWPEI